MKDLSVFLSTATLVILIGYISYKGLHTPSRDTMSDEEVALDKMETEGEQPDRLPAVSFDLPKEFFFAGEPVPMNEPDVRERFDKELQINTYLHSNTLFLMKRANRWMPQITAILKKYNVPEDFKYLPLIESALINDISPKDAVGFWQILKTSGKELGLEITSEVDERYNPLKATEAACKYIMKAHAKFGNWTVVAASYNRGMGGMERALDNQQVKSYYDLYLNDETSRYVFRILAIKEIVEHPAKYGFKLKPEHLYQPEKLRYVTVNETIKDLIPFAKANGTNYKLLKRYNPWLQDDKLTVKKGKTYRIALPQ